MASERPPDLPAAAVPEGDLGFGAVVTRRRGYRLINRDGSFNVRVSRRGWRGSLFTYHTLLSTSWTRLFALLVAAFLVTNAVFACAYLACGPGALTGSDGLGPVTRAFFFSVHTLATIGYGSITPATFAANVVVTLQPLVG